MDEPNLTHSGSAMPECGSCVAEDVLECVTPAVTDAAKLPCHSLAPASGPMYPRESRLQQFESSFKMKKG